VNKFFLMLSILLLFNQESFVSASPKSDIADFKAKRVSIYDTMEHPKAKGLRLKMPYPTSWSKEEGQRPNIVQKIKKGDGAYLISTQQYPARKLHAKF